MRKYILPFITLMLSASVLKAQTPTLGTYPATTIMAGQNTTVTPSAAIFYF